MRKIVLFILFAFLISTAAGLEVSVEEQRGLAEVDQPASYLIHVNNAEADTASLNILDYYRSRWYNYENDITIEPGQDNSFLVEINPGEDAVQGIYRANFIVRSGGQEVRDSFSYRVTRDRRLNLIDTEKNESYKPGETFEYAVFFRNLQSSTSESKTVNFEVFDQSKDVEMRPIVPGGERKVSSNFNVPEYKPPGTKTINITVDGRKYTDSLNVEEVKAFEENMSVRNNFIVSNTVKKVKNIGNTERVFNYSVERPSYLKPVIHAPEASISKQNGSTVYSWSKSLEPGQQTEFTMRTDYWIPLAGLIILLAGFISLKRLTSSVRITKKVTETENGIDVTLEVVNSSSKKFDDVMLEDFIPNIAGLNQDFDMADPEVKQTDDGAELRWWINDLHPGDQRVFKYSIRPKVEVEEGITLDPAILRDGDTVLDITREKTAEFKPE